jgi:hypothetical protein
MKAGLAGIQMSIIGLFLTNWVGDNSPLPLVGMLLLVTGTALVGYHIIEVDSS